VSLNISHGGEETSLKQAPAREKETVIHVRQYSLPTPSIGDFAYYFNLVSLSATVQ
jgi:hypothetical protein